MSRNFAVWVIFGDFQKVCREAHFKFAFRLANILYAAAFACEAVDKIRAAAVNIISTHVSSP